jgi:hypothetical protein
MLLPPRVHAGFAQTVTPWLAQVSIASAPTARAVVDAAGRGAAFFVQQRQWRQQALAGIVVPGAGWGLGKLVGWGTWQAG